MIAIEFRNLSFHYEGYEQLILDQANFSLNYGEIALLSGYSGEGKSTILSLIAGIIPNLTPGEITGEIFVNGRSSKGRTISELCREVGVVLQNAESQIIQQIVEDEIAFACENFAFTVEKTKESISRSSSLMKLDPDWNTRTLSGGQKQRLITAAALATEQKILILDEPLANLDKEGGTILISVLRQLADEGFCVLIIEHRLDMVLPYVDRVWQVNNGKIIFIQDHQQHLSSHVSIIPDTSETEATGETILRLEHLAFTINSHHLLKDVNLEIKRGERLLLLGDNGSGKTTLLRLIARLYRPTAGSMQQYIDPGLGQKRKSRKWFKQVGVVYQNPNYQLFMTTVRDEIAFAAVSDDYAERIMELFGLSEIADRHPHSISEGQKRRLSIAAAAATKPDILLLDEPTVGQDYHGLQTLVSVLNQIHDETGNTMITATHDMRCASALCDRAIHLEEGRISATGGKDFVDAYFKPEF